MKRLSRPTWTGAGLALLSTLALGCGRAAEDGRVPETAARENGEAVQRFIVAGSWDTLATIGGSLQDTILGDPWWIVADEETVYLYDHALQRLLAVAHDGQVRWTAGRKGSGPGEFEAVRDLELVGDEILLLDQENGRITVYGKDGEFRSGVRLDRAGYVDEMAVLADGRIVAFTGDSSAPISILDRSGNVLERRPMPAPFSEYSPRATHGEATTVPGTDRWAYAFTTGPGWYGFRALEPLSALWPYWEKVDFPEIEVEEHDDEAGRWTSRGFAGEPVFAAYDLALRDSLVYVRFGGRTGGAGRIVDRYRFDDGEYVGTYLLPGRPVEFTIAANRVVALYRDPYPALIWLAPRESLDFEAR